MKNLIFLRIILSTFLSIGIIFGTSCTSDNPVDSALAGSTTLQQTATAEKQENKLSATVLATNTSSQKSVASTKLTVHYIDVGQADCILVQNGTSSMLIDAGNNADTETIINYLKKQNIKKLDFVIGSHPHEDHVGSLDSIIKTFDIGKIYMPKATSTTSTFKDVLIAIKNKGLKVSTPIANSTFKLGNALCTILAPNGDKYEDLNNFSIVIKLTYGKNSFLFTGDAESKSESEILAKKYNVKADVLKVGHHGSNSGTSDKFIKAVSPKYAIISVGKGNDYGHPTKETLARLTKAKVQIFRTDEQGTIVATSDGNTIKFDKSASPIKEQAPPTGSTVKPTPKVDSSDGITVYITKTGEKYHADGCQYLSKSKIPIKLKEAKSKGFSPCSKCNPPK